MGTSPNRVKFWTPLLKKVRTKFSKWRCNNLNKAGRATLIKSTLNSIPVHWLSLFRSPKTVINLLKKEKRSFLERS